MNRKYFEEMIHRFREGMTQRLWDQWCAIGVRGVSEKSREVNWIVDPEALLLASTRLFSFEPRLRDVATDWVIRNGNQMSLARLKSIRKNRGFSNETELRDLVETAREIEPDLKQWKSIAFPDGDNLVRELTYNYRRSSTSPDPNSAAGTIFNFRGLFGVNSRAEILLWLILERSAHPALIADQTGWFTKTVQKTLNEMALSGHIFYSQIGRIKHFSTTPEIWKPFVDYEKTRWVSQPQLYDGCFAILDSLEECSGKLPSERVAEIWMGQAIEKAISNFEKANDLNYVALGKGGTVQEGLRNIIEWIESEKDWPILASESKLLQRKYR